jgi:hypothetical protein
MPTRMARAMVLVVGLGLSCGATACITIKPVSIGQKTALERQLAGTYEELDEDLALVASVRGGDTARAPQRGGDLRGKAVAARRRQLFNDDDVLELKRLGCLGENQHGHLELRECDAGKDPATAARAQRLVAQDNQDRAVIIDLALALDASLTPADRPALEKIYAQIMRRQARPGEWVQDDSGAWKK